MKGIRIIFLTLILFTTGLLCTAQHLVSDFHKDAVWIKMIDDPNVNYYTAVNAYNDYWKTHTKPSDPENKLNDEERPGKEEPKLSKGEKRYEAEMIYQIKRFENWMHEELPFVQEDGRILSQQERVAIWKKQQEERAK